MKTRITFWLLLLPLQVAAQYIYFPAVDIPEDLAPETERCYRFEVENLEAQRTKLERKYGNKISSSSIFEHSKGGTALEVNINDPEKGEYALSYFTDPKTCDIAYKNMHEKQGNKNAFSSEDIEVYVDAPSDGFLALRSQPTITGQKLAEVPDGSTLILSGCVKSNDGNGQWCQTIYKGVNGWINKGYTIKAGDAPQPKPKMEPVVQNQNPAKDTSLTQNEFSNVKGLNGDFIGGLEFYKSYIENELAADKKYKGKQVMIIGTVDTVQREDGKAVIKLYCNETPSSFLRAYLSSSYLGEAENLSNRDQVRLKCTVAGKRGPYYLDLTDCGNPQDSVEKPAITSTKVTSKKSTWWAHGSIGKCIESAGPSSIIDMYKESGDAPETRDYTDASGNLYKVDVLMQVDAFTNSIYTFYKSQEDCVNEKEKAAENLSKKYRD